MFVIRKSRNKRRNDSYLVRGAYGTQYKVDGGRVEIYHKESRIAVNLRAEDIAAIARVILASDTARLKEALTGELSKEDCASHVAMKRVMAELEPKPSEPFPRFNTSGVLRLVTVDGEAPQ
jgi:hypothetical protein